MLSLSKKLLLGAAFLCPLLASALADDPYPNEAHSRYTTVTVHVVWMPSFNAVNHFCSWMQGQPIPSDGVIVGCYNPNTSTIYAVEPKNFNDHKRLEVLGHEFWHALGAEHPAL